MTINYSVQIPENAAKAYGVGLPISRKKAIEVCKWIRHKQVEKAKKMLEEVIDMKRPVPFTRYMHNVGHRKGDMAAGRYPINTCFEILKLLKSAESNAQYKGLSSANLVVQNIRVHQAPNTLRGSRQGRIKAKKAHVEIVLVEQKPKAKIEKKRYGAEQVQRIFSERKDVKKEQKEAQDKK